MKKILKRFLLLILAVITITSTFVGCGKKQEVKVSNGPVEIEFWYGLGGKLGQNVEGIIKQFNASQSKYKVKGVAQGSYTETFQALQAAVAAKKEPALVLLEAPQVAQLAQRNLLAPLDKYISEDKDFNKDDLIDSFVKQGVIKEKTYSLPAYGTTQVLYYRKDMFEKNGISPDALNTWEGLSEAAKKMAVKNGNETTVYGWEPMWGKDNLVDAVYSNGGKVLSDDGKTVLIDSPEWVNTWESFRKWIHDDKTMRIHSGGQGWEYWYATIDDVVKGSAAGYIGSSGDQGDLDFTKLAAHEQPAWNGHEAKPVAEAKSFSIPSMVSSEQQKAAFEFIKFFTSAKITSEWSMKTGYIAVRKSAIEEPNFKAYLQAHPQALVPMKQAQHSSSAFADPTNGKIIDALKKAADKVEIENVSVADALKAAKEEAQKALDSVQSK
ncbi:ABC transporter substrate-binding protein [Clostridium sp. P21]|uniref:ABC transporter substrate-binding protein n=1 Tax=Clostridium muellerianum TaxID=2716538 RepID=A0A7Y0EMK5_9CLOT|nr:ABC transporter substrate-binding protein [Clostridium muellerianum]NMM65200.1 ABC transporter substrate-binding protein [Clostridium muellerianum]